MDRTRGIGGSDIAAIMGISPWNTAFGVYLDKIGEGKPAQGKHLELGHKAQGPILRKYEKETGSLIEKEDVEIVHSKYPFLIGHVDGVTNNGKAFVEVKTTRKGIDDWSYEIPQYYRTQVAFYAALGNPDYIEMPVAYWFNQDQLDNIKYFICLTYWRDEAFEQGIIDLAVDFWENHVLKRRPPEPKSLEDIQKRFSISLDSTLIVTGEIKDKIIRLNELDKQYKTLKNEEIEIKFEIQNWMKDSAYIVDEKGDQLVYFKSHQKNSFDSVQFRNDHPDLYKQYLKQTTSRPFTIKEKNLIKDNKEENNNDNATSSIR